MANQKEIQFLQSHFQWCNLYLNKKFEILDGQDKNILNKRWEIISHYCHQYKFKLKTLRQILRIRTLLCKKLIHYMRNVTLVIMRPKNVNECLREILSTSKLSFISLSYIMVLATLLAKNLIVLNIYIYIYIYIY